MMNKRTYLVFALGLVLCWPLQPLASSSIVETRHNLSNTGPGPIKSVADEICIFCHTPHHGRGDIPYLWNRQDSTEVYTTYRSSTLYAGVGQPTGASKLCLSCHDGTIALGALVSRAVEIEFAGGLRFMPEESRARLGTDLSDDHPVSLIYDATLAARNTQLRDPTALPPPIRLDGNSELQCTACHDPHDNSFGKFLVMSDEYSALCTSCHQLSGWQSAQHALSPAQWSGVGADPWPNSPYDSVDRNGCRNCHTSHSAGSHERLLNYVAEEDNCLVCHNGNVASTNLTNELLKEFRHGVQDYFGIHDPVEDFTVGTVEKHVECADCHNPHQLSASQPPAGFGPKPAAGATAGVTGINAGGQALAVADYEYEICFKCHGDTQFIGTIPVFRQIDQQNTRLEFNPANPSFHPVVERGVNTQVPSLISPLTELSLVSCTDCHTGNDPTGTKGPHGSDYPYLLARNYETADYTTETPMAYALCYQCHSRDNLLGDNSFSGHNLHIVQTQSPCSACHDPHGISFTEGNFSNNSHLINFDLDIVGPDSQGRLYFEKLGPFSGQCFLNCHGVAHEPKTY